MALVFCENCKYFRWRNMKDGHCGREGYIENIILTAVFFVTIFIIVMLLLLIERGM